MGVVTYESEETYAVPPSKMFNALASDQIMSKAFPDLIKNIELLEGNGGPGSIKKITFVEGGQVKYVKHKIEEEDKASLKIKYSVIEGEDLAEYKVEKISYEHLWGPAPNGSGSICKTICNVYGDVELSEEQAKAGKEKALSIPKGVEAYLLANPNV